MGEIWRDSGFQTDFDRDARGHTMKYGRHSFVGLLGLVASLALAPDAVALTGVQVGPSGKTYASGGIECALHPVNGLAPMVKAGLYNARKNAKATVLLNRTPVASVNFSSPDATVWLGPQVDTVAVVLKGAGTDSYTFDATPDPGQANVCIPSTVGNTVTGDVEYAASRKSSMTVVPGCALNGATGRAQPFVNLFDNGAYLLNVSVNGVPLTQLNGTTRRSTPVFLAPGLNVVTAANGAASTDSYVRDGGTGTCTLP
ncbi:hypothetical protein [Prosthecomicrobium hirschii]|uniref:hypothetical protein n=1 Tax=Prosthecodimorpha hirschii TaxID=665126 RepID=UPI00221EB77A|nr:hypothetical protein [Prosthecomicrobium hirschii]MCW1840387.1 hypothetical protein [Prosthecomicrobium hirschii]